MRLLIFLLALMSAFFVPSTFADLPDLSDLKAPELKPNYCISAFGHTACSPDGLGDASQKACALYAAAAAMPEDTSDKRYVRKECESKDYPKVAVYISRMCKASGCWGEWGDPQIGEYWNVSYKDSNENQEYFCPPTQYPEHKIRVNTVPQPNEQPYFSCAKALDDEDCPAGYHSKAVSKAIGGSSCVPKDCPDVGSGTSLSSSKMTGGVPFSGGGMYCNDGCAYAVTSSNITSTNYALGTSQGAACGDKPYDNKKLSELEDGSKCELSTNGEISILSCSDGATPPDGTEPEPPKPDDPIAPVDNDDLKKDETKTPDIPLKDCSSDDMACLVENLNIQSKNNIKNQKENDIELTNTWLDSGTRNTNAIIGAIEGFHTTVYVGMQKEEINRVLEQSKMDELIAAVRAGNGTGSGDDGTGTGGGGTGGGGTGGGGDGTGEGGDDCEGSPDECVPVADSELSVEQINLDQYADKYDDWLPNAELPQEKCITLTTGNTMCLSFEFWIVMFQAISGLMVITALLHSAKIITGAV